MNPPDADDLAVYLDIPVDQRCDQCIQAAIHWVERRLHLADPVLLWTRPDVNLGTLQYAALLYQAKATPTGLPEYDEIQATYGTSMAGIYRLLGGPHPSIA